jgi:hypothetical protein
MGPVLLFKSLITVDLYLQLQQCYIPTHFIHCFTWNTMVMCLSLWRLIWSQFLWGDCTVYCSTQPSDLESICLSSSLYSLLQWLTVRQQACLSAHTLLKWGTWTSSHQWFMYSLDDWQGALIWHHGASILALPHHYIFYLGSYRNVRACVYR